MEKDQDKVSLRRLCRKRRNDLSENDLIEKSLAITEKIIKLSEYRNAEIILAYMSTGSEVRLDRLIDNSLELGKKVFIPKVINKEQMQFYLYDGHFIEGCYGIKEPASTSDEYLFSLDNLSVSDKSYDNGYVKHRILMIMPGLAFDEQKNRIGYGGGYYDRFIRKMQNNLIQETNKFIELKTVAVGYDIQIVEKVPMGAYDIRSDIVITENRMI